jgi:leader peptidase (prepilin peptidase)/N-methyltransferase
MLFYLSIIFIFGLLIGSFINVCVYRIPRDESIVKPRSHCPLCNRIIRWYDNIPLISYILLRGKCRHCGTPISLQYPLLELLTGCAFALVAWRFPLSFSLPVYLYCTFVLITISGIDFYHRIIPDFFSFSLIIIGLCFSPFNDQLGIEWKSRVVTSLIGAASGFSFLFLLGYIGGKIMHQEVMGGGDMKLLAGIGAVMGWSKIIPTIFLASLAGSIIGILLIATRKMGRREYIPFGPFLAVSAYVNLFLPDLWRYWINLS